MGKKSQARIKIEQARFFTTCASEFITTNREAFVNYLEAAIVFARSVTFCLQKEYAHNPGFNKWYEKKRDFMKKDQIFDFFLQKRNYILKEGSSSFRKNVSLVISSQLRLSGFVEIKVIRGKPWYRRNPKILWQDFCLQIMRSLRRYKHKHNIKKESLKLQRGSKVKKIEILFFEDQKWENRPALELFQEYLDKLEHIVVEADIIFGSFDR